MGVRWIPVLFILMCLAPVVLEARIRPQIPLSELKTRAEQSNYVETSRYDDVMTFLRTVDAASDLVHLTSFGYTFEGRSLPLAVVGRGLADALPETVRATGRLRVYIQGNIHSGEVEGKEAAQALVRDMALGRHAEWLDSMILLAGPIFNADGNERVNLTNRGAQHGPIAGMGTRPNAQGLNINRDHIKLDTPEARSMVRMINEYDPHILIDLHTTNGSRHAYHLTYEVPNNPAVDPSIAEISQRQFLPAVAQAIRAQYGWEYRSYGNVEGQGADRSWTTVEDLPRYSHNYWGLRNRFGILSETYSYVIFEDRITAVSRFLEEILNYADANAARLREATEEADSRSLIGRQVSLRSRAGRSDQMVEILMGETEDDINPYSGRVMQKRRDVRRPERMWEYSTFESTETERVPAAYYVPANLTTAIERLRAHGIRMTPVEQSATLQLEQFQIDTNQTTPQAFEGHQERTVTGTYSPVERSVAAGSWRIPMDQPLARLAFYLLEPRSNDGVLTWNFLDDAIRDSRIYPILRTRN